MTATWEDPQGWEGPAGRWWRPFESAGPVEVIHVDLAPHPQREAIGWEWLSNEERRRADRFVYPAPRRNFVLCRAAVRMVLCGQLHCQNRHLIIAASRFGKPYALVGDKRVPINFNVSHSGVHGLVAFSTDRRVGVDVEDRRFRRNPDAVAKTVFGPGELALLAGLEGKSRLDAFLDLWTVKEALAKGWGMGLRTDFTGFQAPPEMLGGATTGIFRCTRLSGSTWLVEKIGNGELAAAVAYETGPRSARSD